VISYSHENSPAYVASYFKASTFNLLCCYLRRRKFQQLPMSSGKTFHIKMPTHNVGVYWVSCCQIQGLYCACVGLIVKKSPGKNEMNQSGCESLNLENMLWKGVMRHCSLRNYMWREGSLAFEQGHKAFFHSGACCGCLENPNNE